jgi:hypothetical protein
MSLPISASQVAVVTSINHQSPAYLFDGRSGGLSQMISSEVPGLYQGFKLSPFRTVSKEKHVLWVFETYLPSIFVPLSVEL